MKYFDIEMKKLGDQWNNNLTKLKELNDKFVANAKSNKIEPGQDSFLDWFYDIFSTQHQELIKNGLNGNLLNVYQTLIKPIMIEISNGTENILKNDPRLYEIISPITNCNMAFIQMDKLRNFQIKTVLDHRSKLLEIKGLINEYIKNTKKDQKKKN